MGRSKCFHAYIRKIITGRKTRVDDDFGKEFSAQRARPLYWELRRKFDKRIL